MSSPAPGATRDAARCAQAECIASRHELELVKRDLAELERETDQLHDQLAAKEGECGALTLRLQQSEADAQRQLAVREADIATLRHQLAELAKTNEKLANTSPPASNPTIMTPSQAEIDALRAENAELQASLAQLRTAAARESLASSAAQKQLDDLQKSAKDKRDELYEALKENELLRRERSECDEALEKVSQHALDLETAVHGLHAQQQEYLRDLDDLREDNTQLRTRVDQLEREKQHVEAQLLALDAHERDVDSVAAQLSRQHAVEMAVLRSEAEELRRQLAAATASSTNKKANGNGSNHTQRANDETLAELERQLEMVHELRVQDHLALESRDVEIQQLRSDIQSLVEHVHELQAGVSSPLVSEETTTKKTKAVEENGTLKRRLGEQQSLIHSLELRQAQLEERLAEAEGWNARYEANAGLEDVVKHQKKLRRELERQQLANQALRQQLNDQREAAGKLRLAFEKMRAEAGRPPDFEYAEEEVAEHLRGELAVQQAEARQREEQLEGLEKERVKLLQQLRRQARVVGGRLFEAYGLTVEQWGTVEDFMEAVRLTPEVAKQWSKGIGVKEERGARGGRAEDSELVERLSEENNRLRRELAAVTAENEEQEEATTEGRTVAEKKHAATSPLKAASRSPPVESRGEEASSVPSAPQQSITSPESLAQAIAAALDARLALLQQQPMKASIATQPSPAKPSAVPQGDPLALASDAQLQQQVDFLVEFQLLLDAHAQLGAEHQAVVGELGELHATLQKTQDHQALVYQHALHSAHAAAGENQTLRSALDTLRSEHSLLARKNETYEAALRLVGERGEGGEDGSSSSLRSEVVSLTRRVAEADVADATQRRELRLLRDQVQRSEAHAQQLEDEWVEMEHSLKRRILYLENWKSGAEGTLGRHEEALERSVPRLEAEAWRSELHALRGRHALLAEAYVALHLRLLPLRGAASELDTLRHELAVRGGGGGGESGGGGGGHPELQRRIKELEEQLQRQGKELKTVESQLQQALLLPSSPSAPPPSSPEAEANTLLAERVAELEQLYESAYRKQQKAEEDAQLAAEQARVLSTKLEQERSRRVEGEQRLGELMVATEDHAVVASLQQQLVALRREYQGSVAAGERSREEAQQATRRFQHYELQYDTLVTERSAERAAWRRERGTLEEALAAVEGRDLMARAVKFETFRKRIEAMEAELAEEQARRKALEKELAEGAEDGSGGGGDHKARAEQRTIVAELRRKLETMETRERLLMGQLETFRGGGGRGGDGARRLLQQKEKEVTELQRVHGDMVQALEAMKTRNAELLSLLQAAENQRRAAEQARDSLELELQSLPRGGGGGSSDNQRDAGGGGEPPSSPLMKKKVGLYEQDHLAQQQAAQASIASLKALLGEKNAALEAYKTQLVAVRGELASSAAGDRRLLAAEHKKLFEENQRVIAQLKEATTQLHALENSGGGEGGRRALAAAEDRHALALKEWKRVEVELAETSARVRELQAEVEALKAERDLAEARAGEALEEIVAKHEALGELGEQKTRLEQQLLTAKKAVGEREERMQLLREAVVKLKEEFLKAEDRHAVELARATSAVKAQDAGASRQRREEEEERAEELRRLQAQVEILQEKLKIEKKKAEEERTKAIKKEERRKKASPPPAEGDTGGDEALRAELERLKTALKDKAVSEARVVEELEKKIKVLQAQNLALREAAPSAPSSSSAAAAPGEGAVPSSSSSREAWESEKRLQRRVDVLSMRLKEKQTALEGSERTAEALRQRLEGSEQRLKELQRAAASAREAMQGVTDRSSSAVPSSSASSTAELEKQNRFLQESLVLKRKEWEESYAAQAERYEAQLQRLRSRLALRREDGGEEDGGGEGRRRGRPVSALEREERAFVAAADAADELEAMGEELRSRDRELMEKDTRVMEMELELESLRVEYQRLHRRVGGAAGGGATSSAGGRPRTSAPAPLKSMSQERMELQDVIENMKKVIERLRSENEKLKRTVEGSGGGGGEKVAALQKKLKEVRDSRDALETEAEGLRHEVAELKRDKLRLQQRVRQLSVAKSPQKRSGGEQEEAAELRHKMEELQVLVEKKDAMIRELTTATDTRGGGEIEEQLRARVEALAHENAQLRHELGAFDEEFFEEIEDLKYKYAQAVRDKQQLEAALGPRRR